VEVIQASMAATRAKVSTAVMAGPLKAATEGRLKVVMEVLLLNKADTVVTAVLLLSSNITKARHKAMASREAMAVLHLRETTVHHKANTVVPDRPKGHRLRATITMATRPAALLVEGTGRDQAEMAATHTHPQTLLKLSATERQAITRSSTPTVLVSARPC
jgi:hypothetical protein